MFFVDWICCNRPQGVCLCVCLSVCLCVCLCHLYSPNEWTDFDETLHKSSTTHLLNTFFSDFEHSHLMTSLRPLLLLSVPALSRSQFCSNFLQILGRERKTQHPVWYLKSAKSIDNFGSYGLPRFRKNDKMAAKNQIFEFLLNWTSKVSISTNSDP